MGRALVHPAAALAWCALPSTWGTFRAAFTTAGLARLEFPRGKAAAARPHGNAPLTPAQHRWKLTTARALQSVLWGARPRALPPVDMAGATAFQRRIWSQLLTIACGQTQSYGQVARAIGRPLAARAVGAACGANPIPLLIPCHRVIAADGSLGGFSGGLEWKRRLLALERPQ